MIQNAERWKGQFVNGKFRLGRALGGSDRSAIFLVEQGAGPAPAVIRFVEADSASDQLERWQAASKLSHPNLIRIFETGRCQIAGKEFFYVLSEYADENLAQIVPERALSEDETRQVLKDVLAALAYIHGLGLIHGGLKPSNIFAVGDTVKISSDTIRAADTPSVTTSADDAPELSTRGPTPASDVWSLGMVVAEALTQKKPSSDSLGRPVLAQGIPRPFQEIVESCLQVTPAGRPTLAQIAARLSGGKVQAAFPLVPQTGARVVEPVTPEPKQSSKWAYVAVLAVVAILGIVLIARLRLNPDYAPQTGLEPKPASGQPAPAPTASVPADSGGQVAERTMPEISPSAQRTVQGKLRILIDVNVDENGNVSEARFKSAGPSRYFAVRTMDAAKKWKFKPPVENGQAVASQWRVKFMIQRHKIDNSAEQVKP